MYNMLHYLPLAGSLALIYALYQARWIQQKEAGEPKMLQIAHHIAQGATAFLQAAYKSMVPFILLTCAALYLLASTQATPTHLLIVVTFLLGALTSAAAGWMGMQVATRTNVRTAQAARTGLAQAFHVAFAGGTAIGVGLTGMATLGLSLLLLVLCYYLGPADMNLLQRDTMVVILETLTGFSLGAESVALFARVAGGIYTKAADIGADLVGKIEANIPEDDPRNPATIADNVGDNVGDVAGMGADLLGSYVATLLAAMVLGNEVIIPSQYSILAPILLPLLMGIAGLCFSILATRLVKVHDNGGVQSALNSGNALAIFLTALASYGIVKFTLPTDLMMRGQHFTANQVFYATLTGLIVGLSVSLVTEYFTSMHRRPVRFIVEQSNTGHATNIIAGLCVGMSSTALPMLLFAAGIYVAFHMAGFYGVAMAAASMMSTTAMQLAIDAFGPIADNAGGVAEMSQLPQAVRQRTDILDTVGNTTAATGKGFAIASAALTALALFAAYVRTAHIQAIDIYQAPVLAGLLVGGMIPFLFSALTIAAVGRAAMAMVQEVRRQFREIKGLIQGTAAPEYDRCIQISTQAALRGMFLPGLLAVLTPICIGIVGGPEVLGGFLAGITLSGVLMALFQSNAGGAWDNAKKSFEKGVTIGGATYQKGSAAHKASITGDTVGDPLKDTAGPSMNILIKLSSIVALIIAPLIALEETPSGPAADKQPKATDTISQDLN
ncbi:MAG: sodium-translocating pyrophosphatase [Bacteroidota bacterium]